MLSAQLGFKKAMNGALACLAMWVVLAACVFSSLSCGTIFSDPLRQNWRGGDYTFKKHNVGVYIACGFHEVSEGGPTVHASGKITPKFIRFFMEKQSAPSWLMEDYYRSSIKIHLLDRDAYESIRNGNKAYMPLDSITSGRYDSMRRAERGILREFQKGETTRRMLYTRIHFLDDGRVAVASGSLDIRPDEDYAERDRKMALMIDSVRSSCHGQ